MQTEFDLYAELNDLLQEEQRILVAQNIDKLESVSARKLSLLDKIKEATNARLDYLRDELNLEIGTSFSFANWLIQNNNDALKLWLNLEGIVINTKAINDINAELIQKYLSETTDALEILKGVSASLTHSYDRSGSSNYSSSLQHKYKA